MKVARPVNKCEKCDKQFNSPTGLKMHVTKIHAKKQKETAESLVSENNTLNLSIETEYSSEIENGERKDIEKDINSKKIYSDKCGNCDLILDLKKLLEQHIEVVHDGQKSNSRHPCSNCGKDFHSKVYLNVHIESVHEGRKPFKCNLCDSDVGF